MEFCGLKPLTGQKLNLICHKLTFGIEFFLWQCILSLWSISELIRESCDDNKYVELSLLSTLERSNLIPSLSVSSNNYYTCNGSGVWCIVFSSHATTTTTKNNRQYTPLCSNLVDLSYKMHEIILIHQEKRSENTSDKYISNDVLTIILLIPPIPFPWQKMNYSVQKEIDTKSSMLRNSENFEICFHPHARCKGPNIWDDNNKTTICNTHMWFLMNAFRVMYAEGTMNNAQKLSFNINKYFIHFSCF